MCSTSGETPNLAMTNGFPVIFGVYRFWTPPFPWRTQALPGNRWPGGSVATSAAVDVLVTRCPIGATDVRPRLGCHGGALGPPWASGQVRLRESIGAQQLAKALHDLRCSWEDCLAQLQL